MKKEMPLVSIIIVTWNGKHWLEQCLPSLKKQSYKHTEIIIVDNNSTDGTISWVSHVYPDVSLINSKSNVGFAEGNNLGYAKATGELIYFLNNDTQLAPTAIQEMVDSLLAKPTVAGVQSKLLLMDKRDHLDTIGAFLTPTGFLYHNAFGEKDSQKYDKDVPLFTLKGASMMFKKSALDKILVNGYLFDHDYFAYFEETDICHRLWIAGYELRYAFKAVVWHKMGATSSSMNNSVVQFHSFKNRIHSYLKNLGLKNLIRIVPFHVLLCLGYAFFCLIKGNVAIFKAIVQAILWNIVHIKTGLQKRWYIQHTLRKSADNEFFNKVEKHVSWRYYYGFAKHFV